jgi:NAD(P)-dependent dehydrogenase (short-subunit alcohol dehydrogenase family)
MEQLDANELFCLRGQYFIVTGAASGLGRAIALALGRCEANLLLLDKNGPELESLVAQLYSGAKEADIGGSGKSVSLKFRSQVVDVADADSVTAHIHSFRRTTGRIDGLFANAGISGGQGFGISSDTGSLEAQTAALWQPVMNVNLYGVMNCMQAVLPALKARKSGRIIVTASIAGIRPETIISYVYSAAKAALIQLTRQSARELAPYGITVNAIAPGFIKTNIGNGRIYESANAATAKLVRRIPLGRFGQPEDIQGLAILLASRASAYITGAVIPVDGGYLLT